MSIKYDVVTIRLNEYRTVTRTVAPWETPILEAIHGGNLQRAGSKICNVDPPVPDDEFRRLADRYGPKDSDVPFVAQVYGNFGPGVRALTQVIADSLTLAPPSEGPQKPVKERLAEKRPNPFAGHIAKLAASETPVAAGGVPVADLGLDETEADFSDLLDDEPAAAVGE